VLRTSIRKLDYNRLTLKFLHLQWLVSDVMPISEKKKMFQDDESIDCWNIWGRCVVQFYPDFSTFKAVKSIFSMRQENCNSLLINGKVSGSRSRRSFSFLLKILSNVLISNSFTWRHPALGGDYIQSHCVLHFYFETFSNNLLTRRSDYLMPEKVEFSSRRHEKDTSRLVMVLQTHIYKTPATGTDWCRMPVWKGQKFEQAQV